MDAFKSAADLQRPEGSQQFCRSDLFGRRRTTTQSPSPIADPKNSDSPIHSLPNECLGVIFDEGRRLVSSREGSWLRTVSHVCRRWRNVAVHTPFLWNRIYYGGRLQALAHTQSFLERSQNCPLHIVINHEDETYSLRVAEARKIVRHLNLIIPHSNRWQTLEVHAMHYRSLRPLFLELTRHEFHLLKRIKITVESKDCERWDIHTPLLTSKGQSRLSSIQLNGISFASCQFPVNHLTSITLTHSKNLLHVSELRKTLTSSPSLKELSLLGDIANLSQEDWFSIQIPTLVSLTLSPGSDTSFTHLCAALLMPSLDTLILQHCTPDSIRIFSESLHLQSSTKYPLLRSLEIRAVDISSSLLSSNIINLFDQLPTITQLSLISVQPSNFEFLLPHLHCEMPLPILRTRMPSPNVESDSFETLLGIHPDGVPAAGKLSTLDLYSVSLLSRDNLRPLKPLRLPVLHTLDITPLDNGNIAEISNLISSRLDTGHCQPIKCVRTSSIGRIPQHRLEWLRERVSLISV